MLSLTHLALHCLIIVLVPPFTPNHTLFLFILSIGINTANKTKNNTGVTQQRILLKNQRKNPLISNDDDDDQEEEEDEEFSIGTALSSLKLDNQQSQDSSSGGISSDGGNALLVEQMVDGPLIKGAKSPIATTTLHNVLDGLD